MPTINGRACVANGRNLIAQSELKVGYINRDNGGINYGGSDFHSDNYIATNGATVFTLSSPDYVFKGSGNHSLAMYDSDKNYLGWQPITSPTQTLSKPNAVYIRFSINFTGEGGTIFKLSDWLNSHRYKLETGTLATPWTPAPVDKVFSDGKQVYGRNYFLNSDFSQDETNWKDYNGVWLMSSETCNGQKAMTATPTVAWTSGSQNSFNQTMSTITNQQITVSVWAKASKSGAKFHSEPNGGNGAFDTSLTNTWKSYSYVAHTYGIGTIYFMAVDVGTQYWISMPQVEIGNKVTPWTPAPEDVM